MGNSMLNISHGEHEDSIIPFESNLEVSNAYFMDTGFYYCTGEGDVDLVEDAEAISKIYVYVNDSLNLLVRDEMFLVGYEHRQTIIPCRPTSPDVNVTLKNDDDILNFDFDPKIGFIIRVTHVIDSRAYECVASRGDQTEIIDYHLNVIPSTDSVPAPRIKLNSENHQGHIEVGSTFSLNCSVDDLEPDIKFVVLWQTPNDISKADGRLKVLSTISSQQKVGGRTLLSGYRVLIIENASKNDQGTYQCTVKDHNTNANTEDIHIIVYDKNTAYINITDPVTSDAIIEEEAGAPSVQWVVNFRSFPSASVIWTNDKGENLTNKENMYDITTTFNRTILTIRSITLETAGNYTLHIHNGRLAETRKKTLIVSGLPSNLKISRKDKITQQDFQFLSNKDKYTLRCKLLANPAATVEWRFQACVSYTQCSKDKIEMKGARIVASQAYLLTSEIDVTTEESGFVTCIAKNTYGSAAKVIPFFVVDVIDGFNLIVPPETVVGYEMILSCKASISNYTNSIEWTKDGTKFLPKEGYEVRSSHTKFSYGSDIIVKKLSKKDSGTYECLVRSVLGGEDSQSQDLVVRDVVKPQLQSTNLNRSEVTMSRNTDILELTCKVDGTPSPPIIWYKDDEVIAPKNTSSQQSTNRIELKDRNQSLILHFLRSDDEGRYKCKAENLGGSVENYVDLKVTGGSPLTGGVITIIVILLLFLAALTILLCCKIKKERELKAELTKIGLHHFESGATECINPELGVDEQAELLPYDRKWEFPRDKLKLGKQLGSGAFGVVMKGEAIGIIEGESISTVAVKMVKRNADSTHIKALASELKIMVHLGQHLNVVNLLGACTKNLMKRELLVIVEYCCYGNLQNFLLRHRHCFIDQIVNDTIDASRGQEAMAQALAEDRKSREALEEQNRLNYTALSFQNSDGPSSPPPEFSMRHGSVSSNPSAYQWNTQHTLSTDASGQNSGTEDTALNSNNQPAWRSNYRGDYGRSGMRPILTQDLLCWAFQVARGMDYLVSRKVLHGDLAARNILLAEDNVVKICDFGLARSMYQSSNYKKTGDGPLPVKWMAVESIQDRVFSTQSDIWSFGIVLWEFFSLARTPYPGMEADEKLFNKLVDGYRMEKPRYGTSAIYNLMTDCWNSEPSLRPLFAELGERLGTMLEESVRTHYMDLNNPYLMMNEQHQQTRDSTVEDYLAMMSAPTYCNEMARQKTPVREYVNLPSDDSSNYVPMSPQNGPDSPLTEEDGYLRMNINSPSRSVIFSPNHPQAITFQFPSSSKLSSTDKKSADQNELKPMLTNPHNYTNLPQNNSPNPAETDANGSTLNSILPPRQADDDDRFGDGLKSPVSPCFENPSYQVLNQDNLGRKRGYSEASSSGFHSERDSIGHSPKPSDEPRSSPPSYQEATEMTSSVLV